MRCENVNKKLIEEIMYQKQLKDRKHERSLRSQGMFVYFSLDIEENFLYNITLIVYILMYTQERKIYMAQEILLTSAGLKELEDELEYLRVTGRQEIKEKIQVALS